MGMGIGWGWRWGWVLAWGEGRLIHCEVPWCQQVRRIFIIMMRDIICGTAGTIQLIVDIIEPTGDAGFYRCCFSA